MKTSTVTLVARIIGCICWLGSVMITTQIVVDLLQFDNPANSNTTKWTFKTMDFWTIHHAHQFVDKESHLFATGIFVIFYGICSALLVYSTYGCRRLLAEPWLFCEGACIVCEASSLVAYYARREAPARWSATGALLCLGIAIMMWCVVFEAQLRWKTETGHLMARAPTSSPPPYSAHRSLEQPAARGTPGSTRNKITVV